jgi:hypothetical protein
LLQGKDIVLDLRLEKDKFRKNIKDIDTKQLFLEQREKNANVASYYRYAK